MSIDTEGTERYLEHSGFWIWTLRWGWAHMINISVKEGLDVETLATFFHCNHRGRWDSLMSIIGLDIRKKSQIF